MGWLVPHFFIFWYQFKVLSSSILFLAACHKDTSFAPIFLATREEMRGGSILLDRTVYLDHHFLQQDWKLLVCTVSCRVERLLMYEAMSLLLHPFPTGWHLQQPAVMDYWNTPMPRSRVIKNSRMKKKRWWQAACTDGNDTLQRKKKFSRDLLSTTA